MKAAARYDETITIPRAVRFPIGLVPPEGFHPALPGLSVSVADLFHQIDGR